MKILNPQFSILKFIGHWTSVISDLEKGPRSMHLPQKPLFNNAHALDLAFSREALVETFAAELVFEVRPPGNHPFKNPGGRILSPLCDQVLLQREIAEHTDERLQCDAARKLVSIVGAPDSFHHRADSFQIIRNQLECTVRLAAEVLHEKLVILNDELLDFVEQLRLQNPFLLAAAASQAIDLVLKR